MDEFQIDYEKISSELYDNSKGYGYGVIENGDLVLYIELTSGSYLPDLIIDGSKLTAKITYTSPALGSCNYWRITVDSDDESFSNIEKIVVKIDGK